MTAAVVHRCARFGASVLVCGQIRQPWDKTTTKPARVTCEGCKQRTAAYRKSAKARAALHGIG